MMPIFRHAPLGAIRRRLSRGKGWTVAVLAFVAALLWNQAYVPAHLLSAHGHFAGEAEHAHAALRAVAPVASIPGYILGEPTPVALADSGDHAHDAHGHTPGYLQDGGAFDRASCGDHSHDGTGVALASDHRAADDHAPATPERRHHDHSILDHAFALEIAVASAVATLPPMDAPPIDLSHFAVGSLDCSAPCESSRGPPVA